MSAINQFTSSLKLMVQAFSAVEFPSPGKASYSFRCRAASVFWAVVKTRAPG
jgi:hypothetical protein